MVLYGAPIWAEEARGRKKNKTIIRRIQRKMAIRVVRVYRTVSYRTAVALAGIIRLELQAEAEAKVYYKVW